VADRATSRQADTSTDSVHQEDAAEGTGDDAVKPIETIDSEPVIAEMAGDGSPNEVSLSNQQWRRRSVIYAHSRLTLRSSRLKY